MARLCSEVISGYSNRDHVNFPGTSSVLNVVPETIDYAKGLEASGLSKGTAAVRAIKDKHFAKNGVIYLSRWEA